MAILRDIVRGERDPEKLARHKHARIHASHQEIARSLEGTWREELLFVVGQSLDLYDTYQEKIQSCDRFRPALWSKHLDSIRKGSIIFATPPSRQDWTIITGCKSRVAATAPKRLA